MSGYIGWRTERRREHARWKHLREHEHAGWYSSMRFGERAGYFVVRRAAPGGAR